MSHRMFIADRNWVLVDHTRCIMYMHNWMVLFIPIQGRDDVILRCEVDLSIRYRRKTKLSLTSHVTHVITYLQFSINKPFQTYAACYDSLISILQSYRLAQFVEPQSPSSAQPTAPTSHYSTCYCAYMPSKIAREDWHLLCNGQPWGHNELRDRAYLAADKFMEHLGPDGSIDDSKYLRIFSVYASQLSEWHSKYDFGVSYLTEAVGPDEHLIARAAAAHISRLNHWPDRATTIRKLGGKDRSRQLGVEERFLWNHLKDIEAAYKQEATQRAERVEAGTEAESVPGKNEDGERSRTDNSGV